MDTDYYGAPTTTNEEMTVQERCREFYKIGAFVVVMNIDTMPFVYQVQRAENQSVNDEGVHQNISNIKPPERITMQPGDTRLVPAYEADLMIKALIDKLVYTHREKHIALHKNDEQPDPPKESVRDPFTQRKYIELIYQGQRDFMEEFNKTKKTALDDLGESELEKLREEKAKLEQELAKLRIEKDDPVTATPRRPGRPAGKTV